MNECVHMLKYLLAKNSTDIMAGGFSYYLLKSQEINFSQTMSTW